MIAVKREELLEAFEFVSSAAPMENSAYVCRDTGRIYWTSELGGEFDEEELPDDLDEDGNYLAVPHKNDIDLGRELALRFAEDHLRDRYSEVETLFQRRGAYRRFKDLLERAGRLDQWYAFESDATQRAIVEWCQSNGIELVDGGRAEE